MVLPRYYLFLSELGFCGQFWGWEVLVGELLDVVAVVEGGGGSVLLICDREALGD